MWIQPTNTPLNHVKQKFGTHVHCVFLPWFGKYLQLGGFVETKKLSEYVRLLHAEALVHPAFRPVFRRLLVEIHLLLLEPVIDKTALVCVGQGNPIFPEAIHQNLIILLAALRCTTAELILLPKFLVDEAVALLLFTLLFACLLLTFTPCVGNNTGVAPSSCIIWARIVLLFLFGV
jgi:hypothetical protein